AWLGGSGQTAASLRSRTCATRSCSRGCCGPWATNSRTSTSERAIGRRLSRPISRAVRAIGWAKRLTPPPISSVANMMPGARAERATSMAQPLRSTLLIMAMIAAGYALTVAAFYPGYMTNDATYVYQFMREWRFGDWQSPLMSMLWWVVDPIAPGPGSMFLLVTTLYWLGFAVIALTVARISTAFGLIVPVLALFPPAFMLLVMIWRDVLFTAVWLVAAAIVYASAARGAAWRRAIAPLAMAMVG